MRGIGSLTKAETGTLTANFIATPYSSKISQSPKRRQDHLLGERVQIVLAGAGQEKERRQHAALGMARAHQRLGADQPHGA